MEVFELIFLTYLLCVCMCVCVCVCAYMYLWCVCICGVCVRVVVPSTKLETPLVQTRGLIHSLFFFFS